MFSFVSSVGFGIQSLPRLRQFLQGRGRSVESRESGRRMIQKWAERFVHVLIHVIVVFLDYAIFTMRLAREFIAAAVMLA